MKDSTHPQPSSQGEPKEDILQEVTQGDYKYGFETKISTETIERGLSEEVVRLISKKKEEPEWLLDFRLKAYQHWLTLKQPKWAHLHIPPHSPLQ